MDDLEFDNNEYTNFVDDLIIYKDDGALFLAVITHIDRNRFILVSDYCVLRNTEEQLIPQYDCGIGENDILKNFGNITIEEFKVRYPEWTI